MKKIFIAVSCAFIVSGVHAFNFSNMDRDGYKPDEARKEVAQMIKKSSANVKVALWHADNIFDVVVEKRNVDYKFFASLTCEIISGKGINPKFLRVTVVDVDEIYYGKGDKYLAKVYCP